MRISDEIIDTLIALLEHARDNQFMIGDILVSMVEIHDGAKKEVINYLAGVLRVTASTLYDYYRIAQRWKPEDRIKYQTLDWTIYRNADPVEDKELLEKAIDEGWNASMFKETKYPKMQTTKAVLGRVWSIFKKRSYSTNVQTEIESLLNRLEEIL